MLGELIAAVPTCRMLPRWQGASRKLTGGNSLTFYTDVIPILKEETEAQEPESSITAWPVL